MSRQWIRACKLIVGLQSGSDEALDLSAFRIRFVVRQQMTSTPQSAEIYVYNLSKETAARFIGEGQEVTLQAGYQDSCDVIFKGTVRQIRRGRESQTDTYVCILAQSGDQAHSYAVMNKTVAAGWTPSSAQNAMLQSMSEYGLTAGYSPTLPGFSMPRGKSFYGMTRDYLSDFSDTHSLQWAYDNGQIIFTPTNAPLPGEAYVINRDTGMIGMPVQTITGIYVTALLNPKLGRGRQIKIDNASIQRPTLDVAYGSDRDNYFKGDSALDADGYYKIQSAEFVGDTRGDVWQVMMCCTGVNASQPVSGATINAVG
ncbi:phage protein [Chromobacterium haemolyticum]|uniref:phage protein n=1 Tax=Chromobacterium haemolyticum TaxID=394935 RepID=UPI00059475BA|nr:hypothetical protein [Chromobacterium haemolyticum]